MIDLGQVWAAFDHLLGAGALLRFAEIIAEARDRRDAETQWKVIQRHMSDPPGPGWEPFGTLGTNILYRRRVT